MTWRVRGAVVPLARPVVIGIINVTPDSFSDGGSFFSAEDAVAHAKRLVAEGADMLDVGGESTRPQGAIPVAGEEELRRILPVVRALCAACPSIPISVDTVKSSVAAAAIEAGASVINDVSGLRIDPAIARLCAAADAGLVVMHSRGGVGDMSTYQHASYGPDVVGDVVAELSGQVSVALAAGVRPDAIAVDPGIGFSKRSTHSLAVLSALQRVVALGYPVMVGVSRKRFIGEITGVQEPAGRTYGSIGAAVAALARGARLFRVHDVRGTRQALDAAWAILGPDAAGDAARPD
ncbi:MAG: dihydropteroate synthase [Gemmatimonadales bacterium]|jgi:dihydropteroate synthase